MNVHGKCRAGVLLAVVLWPAQAETATCTARAAPGAELQAAIERAARHERPVLCLGAGEFRLNGFISIGKDGFTLRGQGGDTVLRLGAGIESPVIVVGDYAEEVPRRTIRDVTLERMRVVGGGRGGSELHPDHAYLRNSAVAVRRGERVRIRELDVSECRSACILTEHDSREVTIENNVVSRAAWDGISLNRGHDTVIRGNLIRDNAAAGITTEFLEESLIENNRFIGNGSHGVYLADAYHNVFRDNHFEDNAGAGVYLTCSIRYRDPILCWDNSMSQANLFESNTYVDNGYGYLLGVDSAANCKGPGFKANVSRNELFRNSANSEPDWSTYGYCLRYEGSRTE